MERFRVFLRPYDYVAFNPNEMWGRNTEDYFFRYLFWGFGALFWFMFPGFGISYALSLALGDTVGWATLFISTAALFGLGTNSWRIFWALKDVEGDVWIEDPNRNKELDCNDSFYSKYGGKTVKLETLVRKYLMLSKADRALLPENLPSIIRNQYAYEPNEFNRVMVSAWKVMNKIQARAQADAALNVQEKTFKSLGGNEEYLKGVLANLDAEVEALTETRQKLAIG